MVWFVGNCLVIIEVDSFISISVEVFNGFRKFVVSLIVM